MHKTNTNVVRSKIAEDETLNTRIGRMRGQNNTKLSFLDLFIQEYLLAQTHREVNSTHPFTTVTYTAFQTGGPNLDSRNCLANGYSFRECCVRFRSNRVYQDSGASNRTQSNITAVSFHSVVARSNAEKCPPPLPSPNEAGLPTPPPRPLSQPGCSGR